MKLVTSLNILTERRESLVLSVPAMMRACARAGYRQLDFPFPDVVLAASPFIGPDWEQWLLSLRTLAQQLDVQFTQAHAPIVDFCAPQCEQGPATEYLRRAIIGAELLGCHWLVVHPAGHYQAAAELPTLRRCNIAFFQKWTVLAAARGVHLAVENMWDVGRPEKLFGRDAAQLAELTAAVPALAICWDIEHSEIMGQDLAASLRLLGQRVQLTHVSDYVDARNIHLLPYAGSIDWAAVMWALASVNYEGDLDYELQHYLRKMPAKFLFAALQLSVAIGHDLVEEFERARG